MLKFPLRKNVPKIDSTDKIFRKITIVCNLLITEIQNCYKIEKGRTCYD